MDLFILIITTIIFVETSFLLFKTKKQTKTPTNKRKVYVDTSILIDGRILSIAKTGFIGDELDIPRSVLKELQLLADDKTSEKRSRARKGLEIVKELGQIPNLALTISDEPTTEIKVDEILLDLASKNHATIMSLDFNLIKRAEAEKIATLNINDLVLSVRNKYYVGDKTILKITERGNNKNQGIGHLSDGTMVIVENADKKIGESLKVEFVKIHETSAGKLVFAKIKD